MRPNRFSADSESESKPNAATKTKALLITDSSA